MYPKFHHFEKAIVDTLVDKYVNKFVKRLGYRKAEWLPCVHILLLLPFVLNVFACYARPDFITQIVIVLAVMFLSDTEQISRTKFRLLPLVLLLSIFYDFIWLFFLQDMSKEALISEGGIEANVKMFSL